MCVPKAASANTPIFAVLGSPTQLQSALLQSNIAQKSNVPVHSNWWGTVSRIHSTVNRDNTKIVCQHRFRAFKLPFWDSQLRSSSVGNSNSSFAMQFLGSSLNISKPLTLTIFFWKIYILKAWLTICKKGQQQSEKSGNEIPNLWGISERVPDWKNSAFWWTFRYAYVLQWMDDTKSVPWSISIMPVRRRWI